MFVKIRQKLEKHYIFKKIAKNTSWAFFQNIFIMLLSVITTGIIARYFGTQNYGILN